MHGRTFLHISGDRYTGEFFEGVRHGQAFMYGRLGINTLDNGTVV